MVVELVGRRADCTNDCTMQIRTIILDFGGILMMHNMPGCIRKFQDLLGDRFPLLGLMPNGEGADRCGNIAPDVADAASLMKRYEWGEITTETFVETIRSLSRPGATSEEVLDAWDTMHGGIPDELWLMFLSLSEHCRKNSLSLYMLSNNNEEHWRHSTACYPDLAKHFTRVFLSHEMGCGKPDRLIYEKTDAWLRGHDAQYQPQTTVFVDDLLANRQAGEAMGWHSAASLPELFSLFLCQNV